MTRRALVPACLALIISCSDGTPVDPAPPSQPGFVLFGIVENHDGVPLVDALVELFSGMRVDTTVTGENGDFVFNSVRGRVSIRVTRTGYVTDLRALNVTGNVLSRIQLASWPGAEVLTLGEWIESQVLAAAPPCDPIGWDASAPCRRFLFTAPAAGRLSITIEWTGNPQLDVTLVSSSGGLLGYSTETGAEQAVLQEPVLKGRTYEVRVNSYYGMQDFRIRAELDP